MPTGRVKFYNATKGFGFIKPDDGSKDVFVHVSQLEKAGIDILEEGNAVSYNTASSKKYPDKVAAVDIRVAS